ncbi:MAG: transglutaminase-like domain-containing protein [Lachnospiraceae bacterium]|nr:transglutaminase-like domain-containing protein [Lachnospiraceae bacterium]
MLDDSAYFGFKQYDNSIHEPHDGALHCLVVAILMFTASTGCVLGVLSEFDIVVNYALIIPVLLLSSLYLSFIHLSHVLYVVGYFAFLIVFSYGLTSSRIYANSGFQALLNIINKTYSDHYLLPAVRQYDEIVGNRYLTITTVAVFIGVFLVLLLNVGIFNDMFFFTTFNLTFWPLQLGIFIGRYPSYTSMALLFFSYFSIYFLRHSGHYHFVKPPSGKKPREYFFDYDDEKGRHMAFHKSSARSMAGMCLFSLVLSLIFSCFVSSAVATSEKEALINRSRLKAQMDENVKILTQNGIAGMFNRYQAKGGINGGRLGGVRSISPDYDTDLTVTFVPYTFETLYLRGYVGQQYAFDRWNQPGPATGYALNMPGADGPASRDKTAQKRLLMPAAVHTALMDAGVVPKNTARMTVTNVDAATSYVYAPYFLSSVPENTLVDPYSVLEGYSALESERTFEYTPYSSSLSTTLYSDPDMIKGLLSQDELKEALEYDKEITDNYLQIPPSVYVDLLSYHDKIGTSETVMGQVALIYDYFLKNYRYDFAPGATPYNRDFVTYFLDDQKRGYCAHFASAGTLLLRSYGIPARYVEGYVITAGSLTETAKRVDTDISYYYTGDNPLGESAAVNVEISDGNAHAWTEIYIPSFGWYPVDFTVPATEDSVPSYTDFLSSLSRLFGAPGASSAVDQDSDVNVITDHVRLKLFDLNETPLFAVFILILLILMLIPLLRKLIFALAGFIKRRKCSLAGDHAPEVRYCYLKAASRLARRYKTDKPTLVDDTFRLINRHISTGRGTAGAAEKILKDAGMTLDEIRLLTHSCFYSGKKISRSDSNLLKRFFNKLK